MVRVGLTGNIGSGKTTICRLFETLGAPVYFADEKGKQFLETAEVAREIQARFGQEYLGKDGLPIRKKLAELVFNDKEKLHELNAIIHPKVHMDFEKWAATHDKRHYVIMEAAILFETARYKDFDKIILVTAPEELRTKRVCKRDKVSEKDVVDRMNNQWDEERKIPLADFIVKNDDTELVIPQIEKIHKQLIDISATQKNPSS